MVAGYVGHTAIQVRDTVNLALDGVLFIDHISRLKRSRVVKRFEKAARDRQDDSVPTRV